MSANRPAGITVLAVFHFILGGLGLLCSTCGAVVLFVGQDKMMEGFAVNDPQMQEIQKQDKQREEAANKVLDQKAPWHRTWTVVEACLSIGLSLALLVAGIGLLQMQSWGRWLSVLYALVSIGATLFTIFYVLTYAKPAQEAAVKEFPAKTHDEQQGEELGLKVAPFIPALFLVYPLIVLAVMLMPGTARAFSDQDRPDEDDYRREDYGTRRRRRDDYDDNGGWAERE